MNWKWLSIFSVSAVSSFVATHPATLSAFSIRQHATACSPWQLTDRWQADQRGLVDVNSGAGNQSLVCPVADSSSLLPQSMVAVNVHGYDASTAQDFCAEACYSSWSGTGAACGNYVCNGSVSVTGNANLSLGAPQYFGSAYANDFKSIFVFVPNYTSNASYLKGIFYSN